CVPIYRSTMMRSNQGIPNHVGLARIQFDDQAFVQAGRHYEAVRKFVEAAVAALGVAVRRPGLGWLAVTFVIGALYLGALLRLPRWLIDASPVSRTTAPSSISVVALAVMTLIAVGITMIAGWLFRRRDVV
ncbi:MAG TPA: hypothetical protein PLI79_04650, partial [Mycobacterium sp.]|nr:hypothetical protein [Mycobacterium sp.]